MKKLVNAAILLLLATCYSNNSNGQANQSLSNLTNPTAINQFLVPNVTNTRDLGTAALNWRSLYLGSKLYLNGSLSLYTAAGGNFFVGPNAGNPAVTGLSNISFGYNALDVIATGNYNTGIGFRSLNYLTAGNNNTAVGFRSLFKATSAGFNTALGHEAMYSATTGSYNTATGDSALYSTSTGSYNTANGYTALLRNSSGSYNTATGYLALQKNTTASYNAGYGAFSLYSNTSGSSNTAIGPNALYSNTTGEANTSIGVNALYSNTSGFRNTATGLFSLYLNKTGAYNVANGGFALYANSTGYNNTGTGYGALYTTSTGYNNVGNGHSALWYNSTGSGNTAVGVSALHYYVNESNNTAIGFHAGFPRSTGGMNTFVGAEAYPNADGYSNSSSLGFDSHNTTSNQVWLGNLQVTAVWTAGAYFSSSDARFKKNIKQDVPGLSFINMLKPVTYNFDLHGLNAKINAGEKNNTNNGEALIADRKISDVEKKAIADKEKKIYTGFLAQDVEVAAKKLNYDFSGVYTPQNDKDIYGLSYSEFVVPLVKAVQELSAQNDSLRGQNATLEERLKRIETFLKMPSPAVVSINNASISQNSPNPFKASTVISYLVPERFGSAQISIYNASGKVIKQINVSAKGSGTYRLDAASLAAGAYSYSLVVDGKLVDTKKMILTK